MATIIKHPRLYLVEIETPDKNFPYISDVYIDGLKQEGVSNISLEYSADALPVASLTYIAIPNVESFMKVISTFDTDSIREAIKFLSMQLQFDEDLRDAWIYSIESALNECREKDMADTHKIATAVLERLIE